MWDVYMGDVELFIVGLGCMVVQREREILREEGRSRRETWG